MGVSGPDAAGLAAPLAAGLALAAVALEAARLGLAGAPDAAGLADVSPDAGVLAAGLADAAAEGAPEAAGDVFDARLAGAEAPPPHAANMSAVNSTPGA